MCILFRENRTEGRNEYIGISKLEVDIDKI